MTGVIFERIDEDKPATGTPLPAPCRPHGARPARVWPGVSTGPKGPSLDTTGSEMNFFSLYQALWQAAEIISLLKSLELQTHTLTTSGIQLALAGG